MVADEITTHQSSNVVDAGSYMQPYNNQKNPHPIVFYKRP